MAGAGRSVDGTRTLISNIVHGTMPMLRASWTLFHAYDSKDVAREPSRLDYENRHTHARTLERTSGVNFAVWTLCIHIRSSRANRDTIRIDFGCSVDMAHGDSPFTLLRKIFDYFRVTLSCNFVCCECMKRY